MAMAAILCKSGIQFQILYHSKLCQKYSVNSEFPSRNKPEWRVLSYYLAKIWKWRKLDREGSGVFPEPRD